MSQKTFPVYDHPAYTVRQSLQAGKVTGNAATAKFLAYANMYLFSLTTLIDTIGTSTFTVSSTVTGSAQTIQLTIIQNTNTTGTAVSLTTATFGPYTPGGPGTGTTALAGGTNVFLLNTAAGVAGFGGYYVPAGSELVLTLGTDATSVLIPAIDYQLAPLAPVVA